MISFGEGQRQRTVSLPQLALESDRMITCCGPSFDFTLATQVPVMPACWADRAAGRSSATGTSRYFATMAPPRMLLHAAGRMRKLSVSPAGI